MRRYVFSEGHSAPPPELHAVGEQNNPQCPGKAGMPQKSPGAPRAGQPTFARVSPACWQAGRSARDTESLLA
jgi:hypothetical protein